MAVECFCGCGRKVKFTRRALNGTGGLVQAQLDGWEAREPALTESGEWTPGLTVFLETGEGIADEMKDLTHGGPLRITTSQRDITAWLNESNALLKRVAEGDASAIAGLPEAWRRPSRSRSRRRRRSPSTPPRGKLGEPRSKRSAPATSPVRERRTRARSAAP